jgi:hypothetical protein
MIGMPFQLFIVRSKQSFADKDKTLASFINKYFSVDPMLVDTVEEINDHRNKTYLWYGVVQDCEYIEEQLVRQVHDFMKRADNDFLICYKVLPLESRIVYQPRFIRSYIKLKKDWDVEDRRPLPYKLARLHKGFILDHYARCNDATRSLIR